MSFEGEFASYEPLRRLLDSAKVKALQDRLKIRPSNEDAKIMTVQLFKKTNWSKVYYSLT